MGYLILCIDILNCKLYILNCFILLHHPRNLCRAFFYSDLHPSSRPKKSFSDKAVLSPNATAFDPTSSVSQEKNASSDISENVASLKQHEITRSVNTRARPGSSNSSTSDCGNAVPVSTNTGLSPSSSVGSLASERSTLNPHAKVSLI